MHFKHYDHKLKTIRNSCALLYRCHNVFAIFQKKYFRLRFNFGFYLLCWFKLFKFLSLKRLLLTRIFFWNIYVSSGLNNLRIKTKLVRAYNLTQIASGHPTTTPQQTFHWPTPQLWGSRLDNHGSGSSRSAILQRWSILNLMSCRGNCTSAISSSFRVNT